MTTVSAKELHHDTSAVLDQVEQGETVMVTRNGHVIGRIEPAKPQKKVTWDDVMAEVYEARKHCKGSTPNPVLAERARRRR